MKNILSLINKMLCVFFMIFTTKAYSAQTTSSMLIHEGKIYPIVKRGEISPKSYKDKYSKNRAVLIIIDKKKISKQLIKITEFHKGFALITKHKKAAAAISCLDLALIYQNIDKKFTCKMESILSTQKQDQHDIISKYLDKKNYTLKLLIRLVMRESSLLNYIHENELHELFQESLEKFTAPMCKDQCLSASFHIKYGQLLNEFKSNNNLDLFYRFAQQLEDLAALKSSEGIINLDLIHYETDIERFLDLIDRFLNKVPQEIIHILWAHQNINFEIIHRDIVIYIAQLYFQKFFQSNCSLSS